MRKMYKTPQTETMPVKQAGIICSSARGPKNVIVDPREVNDIVIF